MSLLPVAINLTQLIVRLSFFLSPSLITINSALAQGETSSESRVCVCVCVCVCVRVCVRSGVGARGRLTETPSSEWQRQERDE